ncbi:MULTISPECIES: PilZ domain-containing protein [unclassified Beijerinckia]|uniref:PilZ domain-containing protein n=1 Tax=unclassified Beijerinckia TaxID=2638183 RepID=UPI00089CB2A2|nr:MULTISPECIES: PilZ domain-containing protein [unclassified Beijerinckia]MDH7795506.1 hypothetical protein [Beijerinckia sp. GAS462]SEC04425.1 PilZ domain-containing protein [Beijerinckia sp. 28-YEA-48]
MGDRRQRQRRRTYLRGLIAFNDRNSTLECLVRNLSQNGALISIPNTSDIPGAFEIAIHKQGESRPAQMVWLTETHAGIRFVPRPSNVVSFETARHIQTLDDERRMLRRKLEDWFL